MSGAEWAGVILGGIGAATGIWAVIRSGQANDISKRSNEIAVESRQEAEKANQLSLSANSLSAESNRIAYESNDIARGAMNAQNETVWQDRTARIIWEKAGEKHYMFPGDRNGREAVISGWLSNHGPSPAREMVFSFGPDDGTAPNRADNHKRLMPDDKPYKFNLSVTLDEQLRLLCPNPFRVVIDYTDDNGPQRIEKRFRFSEATWKEIEFIEIPTHQDG
jgi:hypothetical protein